MRRLLLILTIFTAACGGDEPPIDGRIDPPGLIDAQAPDYGLAVDAESTDASVDVGDAAPVTCPVGLRVRGADCVSDIPADPVFSDPASWTTFGGATVDGGLVLDRDAICAPGGSGAVTTIELGDYSDVGPLFVTADLEYDLCDDPGFGQCEPSSILFARIGESVVQIPTPFGLAQPQRSVSFCLPSTAYGGERELAIWFREFEEDACADTDTRTLAAAIRSVRIAQVGESVCPEPGVFADPGFERSFPGEEPIGWDVNTGGTGAVEVRGSDLDRETVLSLNTGCSNAQMQQTVRIPAPTDSNRGVALSFSQQLTAETPLQVRLGPMQRYLINPEPGVRPMCIPSYLWGRAEGLLFRVTGTTDCTESLGYKAVIDDLEFVELPECGPAGEIRDGVFDAAIDTTWNASTSSAAARVEVIDGAAALTTNATCGAATLEQWVTPRDTNAVAFRYRADSTGEHATIVRPLGFPTIESNPLPAASDWTDFTLCLPGEPRLPVSISFTEFYRSMACDVPGATSLELDDVRLTTSPGCD